MLKHIILFPIILTKYVDVNVKLSRSGMEGCEKIFKKIYCEF